MPARRKIGMFLAITFVASWSIALTFMALGHAWEGPLAQAVGMLFMLPPALAALIVKGPVAKDPVADDLGLRLRPNRWWMAAWLVPPLLLGITLGVSALLPGVDVVFGAEAFIDFFRERVPAEQLEQFEREVRSGDQIDPLLRMLIQAMVAGVTINAVIALGEELGWRGFLHHELALGFWRKSAVIGVVWGVWHAPIVALGHNYPEHPAAGVGLMVAWTVLTAPVFTYVRERSGSVASAAILHGTLNAIGGLPLIATRGGNDLLTGFTGFAGFVAVGAVLGLLYLHDRFVATERLMARGATQAAPSEPAEPVKTDPSPREAP